jgi:serine/threonine protein kinase
MAWRGRKRRDGLWLLVDRRSVRGGGGSESNKGSLRVMLGAANGISYLHEHAYSPIFHRDIKSNNILLKELLAVKVAGFGLS